MLSKKVNIFVIVNLLCCISLFSPIPSTYASEKEFIIGVEDIDYSPLFHFSRNGEHQPSFALELLTAFFDSKNYQYRFIALPIKRFDKWFIDHNIDFKFPDNTRWRADGGKSLNLTFSDPIISLTAGTYVLKQYKNIQRDKVTSLMTIRDFYPTLWLDDINAGKVSLHEENTPVGVVRHLLLGNVQATNIDENVINYQLTRIKKQHEVVLAKNIHHENYSYFLSTNIYPEIIKEFNLFIAQEQALIQNLKEKYQIIEAK